MKTLILSGYGTNCETETAYACEQSGGGEGVEVVHLSRIFDGSVRLEDYAFAVFIGGFLDGDDLGSGRACANRFRYRPLPQGGTFLEGLSRFIQSGRLVLGICNGFQLLVKAGVLPGTQNDQPRQEVTLAHNANGRFEDRWVHLAADVSSPCVFTKGIEHLDLPIRHGEGRLTGPDRQTLETLAARGLVPLRYANAGQTQAPSKPSGTEEYPANPNGSPLGAAALCNPTGTAMGLMPHPEAYNHYTNHPQWTRQAFTREAGEGLRLFENAYRYLRG